VLDFMGFAQKGGSVLSFVRLADVPSRLNQVRIDTQQADAILACDLVVGASPDALATVRHGRTRILSNTHEVPVAESLRNPDASLKVPQLLEKLRFAAGADRVETLDAQALAEAFLGDSIYSNIVALGSAWQRGLVPLSLEALQRAIELNGVAVENNRLAFSLGRLAAGDAAALESLLRGDTLAATEPDTLEAIVARGLAHLTAYQDGAYARRYAEFVEKVRAREASVIPASPLVIPAKAGTQSALPLPFTRAVAQALLKLMAYKDEYEVARLYTDGAFQRTLHQQFEGDIALEFYMAPPALSRSREGKPPRKIRLGAWMLPFMKLLSQGRRLRGTALDIFGRTSERRMERELIAGYMARIESLLPALDASRLKAATDIAALPLSMRGFGHVKLANVVLARAREAELLHRFDPSTYPRPVPSKDPGQIRGIRVTASA
jgi:indolepyruvate ferredoxin oxidoreductase